MTGPPAYLSGKSDQLELLRDVGDDATGQDDDAAAGEHKAVQQRLVLAQAFHEGLALHKARVATSGVGAR